MAKLEDKLNIELGGLLADRGLAAVGEDQQGSQALDVLVEVGGLQIVIEAKRGNRRKQAVEAVDRRFRQRLAMLGFALCYPADAKEGDVADADLSWALRTREAWSAGKAADDENWETGRVAELAEALRLAPGRVADADRAAQQLSDGLDAAVRALSASQRRMLADRLDLPKDGGKKPTEYFTAAKRGMLVLSMAMLFHQRVHEHLPEDPPDEWNEREYGTWPPSNLRECAADADDAVGRFGKAWRTILLVDYRPVFESALAALNALGGTQRANLTVHGLAGRVEEVARTARGLRHDLLGRIFHKVLDTARYDGSFYTSTAAATLLAALAIREEDHDWSDVNEIANLRICDPACGTGTLLMAAAERIHQLRRATGPTDAEDESLLALRLVEDVLWGYDVNLTATHMAASTLGMLSPKTTFGRMRIFRTLLGVKDGLASVGSLELLGGQLRLLADPGTAQVDTGEAISPPAMDVVIMNPPFTRDSLRHDQFSRSDELLLKSREAELFDQLSDSRAAPRSGAANAFLVLASTLTEKSVGTIGVVLPTALATNPVARETRAYLARQFHIEMIITSHDPERIFMSENTSIGEMLVVCRRWRGAGEKPSTTVINLSENPKSPIEAASVARQINSGGRGVFTRQEVAAEQIANGDWTAVNFFDANLVSAFRDLRRGARGEGRGAQDSTANRCVVQRRSGRIVGTSEERSCESTIRKKGRTRRSGITRRVLLNRWRRSLTFTSFQSQAKKKRLRRSGESEADFSSHTNSDCRLRMSHL